MTPDEYWRSACAGAIHHHGAGVLRALRTLRKLKRRVGPAYINANLHLGVARLEDEVGMMEDVLAGLHSQLTLVREEIGRQDVERYGSADHRRESV